MNEYDYGETVQDEGIERFGWKNRDLSIESGKAFDMFWRYRRRTFCDACEPLILGLESELHTCHCEFYNHFVGGRWLCITCFFVEEAKTYMIKQREIVAFQPGATSVLHRGGYVGVSPPRSCRLCHVGNLLTRVRWTYATVVSIRCQSRSKLAEFAV